MVTTDTSLIMSCYDRWKKCAKCGYLPDAYFSVSTEHQPSIVGRPERLKRTCPRCAFIWYERPLDACDPEAKAPGRSRRSRFWSWLTFWVI